MERSGVYSGTLLTKYSGRIMGGHQKIDRVARRHLAHLLPDNTVFPNARHIVQFEGRNGPDGLKLKSPGKDEPWHYYNPFNAEDTDLLELIQSHYDNLVKELKAGNKERSAFEAAWLAHAIVDGLTPAHHYPYEEKLVELMGGQGLETRTSVLKKNIMPGHTRRERIKNNWKVWGPKGLVLSHGLFEIGIATLMKPLSFTEAIPKPADANKIVKLGAIKYFVQTAKEIAVLDLYKMYHNKGWTPKLAYQIRHKLAPSIVRCVSLVWYAALVDAKIIKPQEQ